MAAAEARKQARMQAAYTFQQEEAHKKQERRNAGSLAMQQWTEERRTQIARRMQTNKEEQANAREEKERMRLSMNPWEKVVDNCDFSNTASHTKDMSRMKQVIQSRKADLAKKSSR